MNIQFRNLWLLCLILICMVGNAFAQSACTAAWGLTRDSTPVTSLRYFNVSTGQWSAPLITFGTGINPNALAVSSVDGKLYYVDRPTQGLFSVNLNVNPVVATFVGTLPAPPAPALTTNMLGGTTDAAGRLYVYATEGSPSPFVVVAQISIVTGATLTSWTQMLTTAGATPALSGSGDFFIDPSGSNWIISNTDPPTLHRLDLNAGVNFGRTNSPALSLTGAAGFTTGSVASDPFSQNTYMGGDTGGGPPFSSVTFAVNLVTGTTTQLIQTDTSFRVVDMGSCVNTPAPPTISKAFTPSSSATAPATTTLLITIGNTNSVPFYLNKVLTDVLPTGLLVGPIPSLQGSCVTTGNVITATAGANNATFAAGGRVPAGGCTISFVVSAAAVGAFVNTIPAGSLTTSAGSNLAQAQATYNVGVRDFSITKTQRAGTSGTLTSGPISVPSGSTMQYVLTIVNNAGSPANGTVTFIDLLPSQMTPLLGVTAFTAGAGTCATATSVVTARTQVNGTFTAAPIGGTCTVTITVRASVTAVLLSFPNTVTMGPVAPTTDAAAGNNNATVTTIITPGAHLTISKTNNTTALNTLSTTSYTVTVANLTGGAAANGALVADPVKAGLSCTSVACTSSGGAVCPGSPLSMAAFQTTGLPVSTFPAGSSANFVVSCLVTATGY